MARISIDTNREINRDINRPARPPLAPGTVAPPIIEGKPEDDKAPDKKSKEDEK